MQNSRSPTIAELAQGAGVDEEAVLEALESRRAYTSVSLSSGGTTEDGEELDPLESLGDVEPEYAGLARTGSCSRPASRCWTIASGMILRLRFFEGLTQSEIASEVGISQMHVSRLIRRSLEKIRDEIDADVDIDELVDPRPRRLTAAQRICSPPRLHCRPWR